MADECQKYFAGLFQKLFDEYEAGYVVEQHCRCPVCQLQCEEMGLPSCANGECEGCKNLASGKKIRSYRDDILKEFDW